MGNEIVQLPSNHIPKGLVELEGMFKINDGYLSQKSNTKMEDLEEINLGYETSP